MPRLSAAGADGYLAPLNKAMAEFDVSTPLRQAAFLAQVAHESGELRWWKEIWGGTPAQLRYEGRKDLGNTQPGDGKRFRGRGPIQITGRSNYHKYGLLLGLPLVTKPEMVEAPEVGFRVAACFWRRGGLNEKADRREMKQITRVINGGYNGLAERLRYYELAKDALGVPDNGV